MIIRPFNSSDAKTFYQWYHDKRLGHFYRGFIHGVSVEQCMKAPDLLRGHIHIGLDEDNQTRLGAVTLADRDRVLRIYKLGLLVDPNHQNKSYGKELLAYGLDWAFKTMDADRVIAEVLTTDERTVQGVKAAGFTLEGCMRQSMFLEGKCHDEYLFSMLKSEF